MKGVVGSGLGNSKYQQKTTTMAHPKSPKSSIRSETPKGGE